jgi:hypothetical protein
MIGKLKKMFLALPSRKKVIINPEYMSNPQPKKNHLTNPPKLVRLKWHDGTILKFYTEKDAYEFFYRYGAENQVIRLVDKQNYIRTYESRGI